MQRYSLSQYAPLAVVSATHRNSALWGNQISPQRHLVRTHTFLKLCFFLFTRWYVPPSCTSAEACVEVWPNAQLQGWFKCSVARNQTCLTMCVKCRCCATNRFSLNVLRQSACLQPSQSPPKRGVCIRAKEGNVGGNWWGLVPRYLSCSALYHCFSGG